MYSGRLKYINSKYGTNFTQVEQIPPFLLDAPIDKRFNGNNNFAQSLTRFFNEITIEAPNNNQPQQSTYQPQQSTYQPQQSTYQPQQTSTLLPIITPIIQLLSHSDLKNLVDRKIQEIFGDFLNNDNLKSIFVPKTQIGGAGIQTEINAVKVFRNDGQEGNVAEKMNFPQMVKQNYGFDDDSADDDFSSHEEFLFKKQFCDVFTTFINSQNVFCDKNLEYIVRFQYLIIMLFTGLIKTYIKHKSLNDNDVKFIYKGGTTMKIIHSQYLDLLNKCDCDGFKKNIADCFDRSDSDYHIKISKDLIYTNKYNDVYYDISRLIILALKHIKSILIIHNKFFMDTQNNITSADLQKLMVKINEKLTYVKTNKSIFFKNVNKIIGVRTDTTMFVEPEHATNLNFLNLHNNTVTTREDFYVTKENVDNMADQEMILGKLKYKPETDVDNNLFITANETLKFAQDMKGKQYVETFLLSRIKYNFVVYYINDDNTYGRFNSYSEIVDISMNKQNASPNLITIDDMFSSYKYTFQKGTIDQLSLEYTGYSIKGFLADLILILFYKSRYPWDDQKYTKRLYRSLFFMYIELVQNKLLTLSVLNCITDVFSNILTIDLANFDTYINSKFVNTNEFVLFKETVTYAFVQNTVKITNDARGDSSLQPQLAIFIKNFSDTINEFKRNLNLNVMTNCGVSACEITQIGGTVNEQKYLKYLIKNKQLLKMIENGQL